MNAPTPNRILVSACLLGQAVRYHGGDARVDHPLLAEWQRQGRLVPLCPEVAGGLPVPRPPSEITGGAGGSAVLAGRARVLRRDGGDVTDAFTAGARAAVLLCQREGIHIAILKEASPSCGANVIYDGTFSSAKVPGVGVTAALLRASGVQVFSDLDIDRAAEALRALDEAAG